MIDIEITARLEFPLASELIYLNHAAVAPIPRRAADALHRFVEEYATRGAQLYAKWLETETTLRGQLARLINAPSVDDIGLLKNTSEALSVVAHGFPWRPGDNVVTSNEEFPSNRVVWETLASRGVTLREADLRGAADPESALIAATDRRTRVLAVSSVQFASGLRLDLAKLGAFCRDHGIALCVDAIQAVGAVAQDVQHCHVDFLMADGHKWMLGPEGIALFYCAAPWREQLTLHQYGWHMREDAADYDSRHWIPARSARRFECGSPNMLGIQALSASLELLLEIGAERIERAVLARSEHLFEAVAERPDLALISDATPGRYAGIVTFRSRRIPAEGLYQHLRTAGVVCARRGDGIRFSPHFYTPMEQLDQALMRVPSR